MFAEIVTTTAQPGKLDEAVFAWEAGIYAELEGHRGFRQVPAVVDRKADQFVVLSLWDSESDSESFHELPRSLPAPRP